MEQALEEFINYWKAKKYVTGILLSGSYSVGLENENSDVDIRLVFTKKHKKSIKGVQLINGYKFSYLGRPLHTTLKKFSSDFLANNKFEIRIFSIGKILYDKQKSVDLLIETAKVYLQTPFVKRKMDKETIEINMYSIYCNKIFLESLPESSPFFSYHYYNFFKQTLKFYGSYLGYEYYIDSKIEKILTDTTYQKIYFWDKFPDQDFLIIWLDNLNKNERNSIILIYLYLSKKILNIDEKKFTMLWIE
ncbi:nucleotidyltransferase domain-containing protein [Chryseobacterium mucoviscidosis]|uniref:nucleotidyltransferase domain-containing protein n=1 Tax=Chryseobacterium mucoviscidosis TaxID=1945581 RepID=UPI003018F912